MQTVTAKRSFRGLAFITCLLIPPLYLIIANQGVSDLLRSSAPDGQLYYILSRLLGLYALIILCWQAIAAWLDKTQTRQRAMPSAQIRRHILTGASFLTLILLHAGLFVTAVSARGGELNLKPLVPDFSGYYHSAVSLGVLALILTLIAACAGLLRKRLKTHWKLGHGLIVVVLGLVFLHAWMIGSDVQSALLWPVFMLAAVVLLAILLKRGQMFFPDKKRHCFLQKNALVGQTAVNPGLTDTRVH